MTPPCKKRFAKMETVLLGLQTSVLLVLQDVKLPRSLAWLWWA